MESHGRYELLSCLGRGGMAEVFLARLLGPHGFCKKVVVKRVLPGLANDPVFVRRLIHEARVAANLHHENIVQILELGDDGGRPFIALEHVDGKDLWLIVDRLKKRRLPMPTELVVLIVRSLLSALAHAHACVDDEGRPLGLVHRDVSSSNVLVSWQGAVKLIDFGIARANIGHQFTTPGRVVGKAMYMAPEQLRGGQVDGRADVHAVGVLMHLLLTNEAPPPGRVSARLPAAFHPVVAGALAEVSDQRFTADAMLQALAPFGQATSADLAVWLRDLFADEVRTEQRSTATAEDVNTPVGPERGRGRTTATGSRRTGRDTPLATIASQLGAVVDGEPEVTRSQTQPNGVTERETSDWRLSQAATALWVVGHARPPTKPRAPIRAAMQRRTRAAIASGAAAAALLLVGATLTAAATPLAAEQPPATIELAAVVETPAPAPAPVVAPEQPTAVVAPEPVAPPKRVSADGKAPRVKRPAPPEVVVRTTPPGAVVAIDGVTIGSAPLRTSLSPGLHQITLVDGDVHKELPLMVRAAARPIVLEQRMR